MEITFTYYFNHILFPKTIFHAFSFLGICGSDVVVPLLIGGLDYLYMRYWKNNPAQAKDIIRHAFKFSVGAFAVITSVIIGSLINAGYESYNELNKKVVGLEKTQKKEVRDFLKEMENSKNALKDIGYEYLKTEANPNYNPTQKYQDIVNAISQYLTKKLGFQYGYDFGHITGDELPPNSYLPGLDRRFNPQFTSIQKRLKALSILQEDVSEGKIHVHR